MDANEPTPANELTSEKSPVDGNPPMTRRPVADHRVQRLTWFPAIVLALLVSLPFAKLAAESALRLAPWSFDPFVVMGISYGCLIGFGGQRVQWLTALFFVPWAVCGVCSLPSWLSTFPSLAIWDVFFMLLYASPLLMIFPRMREHPIVGASYDALFAVWIPIAFVVAISFPKWLPFVLPSFWYFCVVAILSFIGYAPGWLLRRMLVKSTSTNAPPPVTHLVPRQFSLMSMFALTTAAAIFAWVASVIHFSSGDWINFGIWTVVGIAVGILVCRYLSDPILPEPSLEELRGLHDPSTPLIQCPHCHRVSRRNTCFCPHCNESYYQEEASSDLKLNDDDNHDEKTNPR